LNADPLSVNYPDDLKALRMSFREISDGYSLDVLRRERMKVDRVGDLEVDRFGERIV
jgi:hypothetical protein